jgi:hypothetical protein
MVLTRDAEGRLMKEQVLQIAYEIEVQPGEKLTLPRALVESVGPGRWVITVQPAAGMRVPVRSHSAFLSGYATEDEGLYDDYPGR